MAQKRRKSTRRRPRYEFKPDELGSSFLSRLHLTKLQQRQLLRWALFGLICILGLVLQDVIMSRFSLLKATTDLVPCAILLITVMEGTEIGSIFVLIASTLYYFSGNAPTAFCIGLMAFFGIGAGINHPPLHTAQYEYPDALLEYTMQAFLKLLEGL